VNNNFSSLSSPVFPHVFTTRYRAMLAIWAGMAVMNLSAGIVIASWPERQSDLNLMHAWTTEWLVDGTDIYTSAGDRDYPDYPPHAIVALSPLALLSGEWLVPAWAALNIGLAILATYLAVRSVWPLMTITASVLPVCVLLTWGGFRTLLQFTLFSVTCGLLSMVLSEKRPILARETRAIVQRAPIVCGICLALAMSKPQVGAPFLLWALFTRRIRTIAIAFAAVVGFFGVYCIRAHANPVHVVARYFETVWVIYTGETVLIGLAQLRPLAALLISDFSLIDTIAAVLALLMLALVLIIGFAEGKGRPRLIYSAPALAGFWSLLTFYHLTYGFVVLLPAAALLMLVDDPPTARFRKTLFWVLQLGLMVDIPGIWRRVSPLVAGPTWINALAIHFDRILMLVLFAGVLRLAVRPDAGRSTLDDRRWTIRESSLR
jgi:hypothetical protein